MHLKRLFIIILAIAFLTVTAPAARAQNDAPPLKSETFLADDSLLTETPCGPPCFDNITPGKTTLEQASVAAKADTRVTLSTPGNPSLRFSTAAGVSVVDIFAVNNVVDTITVRLAPKITTAQIIAKYGEPKYTFVSDYTAKEVAVGLIYSAKGVIVWVSSGDPASSLTPESPVVFATYFVPENFEKLVRNTPLSGWAGYVPYQTFRSATPARTPLPLPTNAPLPTSAPALGDAESPCYVLEAPTVEPIANPPRSFAAPEQVIDPTHTYCAFIATERGVITAELYTKDAPKHVNSLAFLASKSYYDGVTWHRVIANFVAQTGDPKGDGSGGPGYTIPLETNTSLKYDRPGILGMARTNDPNSAGSQFFITYAPLPSLNPVPGGGYTIFGRVVKGFSVVQMIRPRDQGEPSGDKLLWLRVLDASVKQ